MCALISPIRPCPANLTQSIKERIEDAAVPDVVRIHAHDRERMQYRQKFFPIDSLRKIFPINVVKDILSHNCEVCRNHLLYNRPAHPDQYPIEKILRTDAALSIFALLVYLGYPLLIGTFLISYNVLPLPRFFSEYDLEERQFSSLPLKAKQRLATAFQEKKWQFSAPTFADGDFQKYEKGTILPYLDEEQIGSGAFSKVYKIWVHSYYCTISPVQVAEQRHPGAKVFARKEIEGDDAIEFIKEKTSLERIKALKDDHLVQIQKTYQLGATFNILFPCAMTNLQHYLRDSKWRAPQCAIISRNPLWKQVLGITKALWKIIHFKDPEDPGREFFGYHLDLKPQNILVDRAGAKDVLKITDFGQTKFVAKGTAGTSHVTSFGGTDAYAPPEFLENKQDSVYDVWSLGIIVLEILAYAVKGIEGLVDRDTGLDNIRHTDEGNHGINSRFYTYTERNASVKPEILKWMESLLQDPLLQNAENRKFVEKLLDLIKRMLQPQTRHRIVIEDVVSAMADILGVVVPDVTEVAAESLKLPDEIILIELKEAQYYPRGTEGRQSMPVSFIMVENISHQVRTWVGTPPPPLPACDQRQEMQLSLPFQHTQDPERHSFEVSFSSVRDHYAVSLHNKAIIVNRKNIARRLQMALTGHITSESYRLESISLKKYQSIGSKFKDWTFSTLAIHKGSEIERPTEEPIALWAEIWIEKPQIFPESASSTPSTSVTTRHHRANRQVNPGKEVPQGRIVIYCLDRIYILPFTRECQLRKQEDMGITRSREVIFEPMDKKQSEFFRASEILPERGNRYPAIPMFHTTLCDVEERCRSCYEQIAVEFKNHDDAFAFYKLYKNEKARWLDESKGRPALIKSLMPTD